jgi:hypothetical protein
MTAVGINEGDSLRAEKVFVYALKITHKGTFRRTGGHNSQFAVAGLNVECLIVKPMVPMVLGRSRE